MRKKTQLPISAVFITLNEEVNLLHSLPKLYWCDEIIVVDSGSTDNTLKICKQYKCKIYHRAFDNYSSQKKFAVSLTKNNWVLSLDADEVMSDPLVEELQQLMLSPDADGYYIRMSLVFLGNEFRYGKEANRYYLRLFDKTKGGFNDKVVHEGIEVSGVTKKLSNQIYHYSYSSFEQFFNKQNMYSSYGVQASFLKGKKKSLAAIISCLPFYFFKYYFLEKNLLNGRYGFYWSVLMAYYHFSKYIKLNEMYAHQTRYEELGIPFSELIKLNAGRAIPQNTLS